jgi:hypothetical protein
VVRAVRELPDADKTHVFTRLFSVALSVVIPAMVKEDRGWTEFAQQISAVEPIVDQRSVMVHDST